MHANERQDVDRVYTGDIAAGIGFDQLIERVLALA